MEWKLIRIRRHVVTLSPYQVRGKKPHAWHMDQCTRETKNVNRQKNIAPHFVFVLFCFVLFSVCANFIHSLRSVGSISMMKALETHAVWSEITFFWCSWAKFSYTRHCQWYICFTYRIYTFTHDIVCTSTLRIHSHGCGFSIRIFALIRHHRNISRSIHSMGKVGDTLANVSNGIVRIFHVNEIGLNWWWFLKIEELFFDDVFWATNNLPNSTFSLIISFIF